MALITASTLESDDKNPTKKPRLIFRPWRINKSTGKKEWARTYGLKAWPIPVDD